MVLLGMAILNGKGYYPVQIRQYQTPGDDTMNSEDKSLAWEGSGQFLDELYQFSPDTIAEAYRHMGLGGEPNQTYHPDCPACLRGRNHTRLEHELALRRVFSASR